MPVVLERPPHSLGVELEALLELDKLDPEAPTMSLPRDLGAGMAGGLSLTLTVGPTANTEAVILLASSVSVAGTGLGSSGATGRSLCGTETGSCDAAAGDVSDPPAKYDSTAAAP